MLESRNEIIKCKFDITFFYLIEDILSYPHSQHFRKLTL